MSVSFSLKRVVVAIIAAVLAILSYILAGMLGASTVLAVGVGIVVALVMFSSVSVT